MTIPWQLNHTYVNEKKRIIWNSYKYNLQSPPNISLNDHKTYEKKMTIKVKKGSQFLLCKKNEEDEK